MSLICISISAIAFISYVLYIYFKYGVLTSISHSYYMHNKGWLFTAFMWIVGFPITFMAESGWLFFSGAFLMFCGAAPAFKGKTTQSYVHSIGAEGGIVLGMMSLVFDYGMWYMAVAFIVPTLYMMWKESKNHTWWIEVMAFVILSIGLLWGS